MTRTAREQDTVRIFDVKEHSKTRKGLLSMARSVLTLKFTSVLTIVSICMTPCHCTCQDRIHCGRILSNVTHMYTHLQVPTSLLMTSLDMFYQCPGAKRHAQHALDLRTAVQRKATHVATELDGVSLSASWNSLAGG